jgi:hypothetical protein
LPSSGHEDDASVASGPRPGLLDPGERHGVDVEADLAGGDLLEQAIVGGRGVPEVGRPADPAAEQLDGGAAQGDGGQGRDLAGRDPDVVGSFGGDRRGQLLARAIDPDRAACAPRPWSWTRTSWLRPATTTRAPWRVASCVAIRPEVPVAPSTSTAWPAPSSPSQNSVFQAPMPGLVTAAAVTSSTPSGTGSHMPRRTSACSAIPP